jgi:hypothetical protein
MDTQTPACNFQKPAGVCSTSGYVFKKAGGMFFTSYICIYSSYFCVILQKKENHPSLPHFFL